MRTPPRSARFALSAIVIASLAACGGGNDDDGGNTPPASESRSGVVVADQPVSGVTVCLDLNANGACDTGEPAAQTDAQGAYSVKTTAAQSSASVIALMTQAAGASSPYVLRQVPGKGGQINPLTTLVAAGVAAGMTEAAARSNTAVQLGIAEAKIDNFQDDPANDPARVQDNARTMARMVAAALQRGAVLEVGDQTAASADAPGDLANLSFGSPQDYYYRVIHTPAKAAGATPVVFNDLRTLVSQGAPVTDVAASYRSIYLTPTGWKRCNAASAHIVTRGNPYRATYCETEVTAAYVVPTDVSGQRMADVITAMRADGAANTLNTDSDAAPLLSAVGGAVFPANSAVRSRTSLMLNQHYLVNNTNADFRPASEATTLEEFIAAYPATKVNLANGRGTRTLGYGATTSRTQRFAFTGVSSAVAGTVQYYDCALDATETNVSDCAATATGTYTISTISGSRIMSFTGYAPAPAYRYVDSYAQITTPSGERIARVRSPKLDSTYAASATKRLNSTAWAAMKSTLGL